LCHRYDFQSSHAINIEEAREYCLQLNGVVEEQPFGPDAAVYKVMGKMFALLSLNEIRRVSLKNTPEKNIEIRGQYEFIEGAWHMNKKHWSMVGLDVVLDQSLVFELIKESYDLVVAKLPKKLKEELNNL
jgi:predicted DNA-binding protein (MmcQ/YjbR family)